MNRKSGVTLSSLVIYVILFFAFAFLVTTVTANLNKTMFINRGKVYNLKNQSKLNAYMVQSSKESGDVNMIGGSLVFSNNDEYTYNQEKKILYKNGKVVLRGVTKCNIAVTSVGRNIKEVSLDMELEKYMNKKVNRVKFAVREGAI